MTVPDPIAELVALLKANSDVDTAAGSRIFGGLLTEAARKAMPQTAIVVKSAGGPGRRGKNRYRNIRVDVINYGATVPDAENLHRISREAIETLERTGSLISANVSVDGISGVDPTTQWPTCFASYLVLAATQT